MTPRVIVVGGGFGGLSAALALARQPVEVTLVDRRNFHLFQPLLYQVATGALSPANIAAPLRALFAGRANARVLLGEVATIDPAARTIRLADGAALTYDHLVLATGARHQYFGRPEWERHAPGLKTIEDATAIRARILAAFERAERAELAADREAALTFVVAGGGPTGVELAGAIAEIARHTLRGEFRAIRPEDARILLVDPAERPLTAYPEALSARARDLLERLGVTVLTGRRVTAVDESGVALAGPAGETRIAARTVLWAAGVEASPLGRSLAAALGLATDRAGRLRVEPDLTLPGLPEISVLGDLALCPDGVGGFLPGIAPVAMQQGRHAARAIAARMAGKPAPDFRYVDKGMMATIGRGAAVALIRGRRFSGFSAWLLWLFVHLMYLVAFENRVLVFIQWAWNYLTRNRAARLITGDGAVARKSG